jgi:predicted GNAT family N-acyltransferase
MFEIQYLSYRLPSTYWQQTAKLRLQVFVEEQGVPEDLELDEWDQTAQHFIALKNDRVIATVRILLKDNEAKLGRLAVLKSFRKQRIATQLMFMSTQFCQQQKITTIRLGAQISVQDFYAKLGYRAEGNIFNDAGIPHITMLKKIN